MRKTILGLDLGTNSIGWALLATNEEGTPDGIIGVGSRIFNKAVEDKTPTPKNMTRRDKRLARRVLQRRARRKRRMQNYLIKLGLLPPELSSNKQPEVILNTIGDPYHLRAKSLDEPLTPYELGRTLLHLVQRRGFLSNRKTVLGDMSDDPDVLEVLAELEQVEDKSSESAKEETAFKHDINQLRTKIAEAKCRTLGEYLSRFPRSTCKRNRMTEGGHLRTDRQMYKDELQAIINSQRKHHSILDEHVVEQFEKIIFFQRPLKLNPDRVGKCSLEPDKTRALVARLELQRFRYWQDINNLEYFDRDTEQSVKLSHDQRQLIAELLEQNVSLTYPKIRKALKLHHSTEFNLENSKKKITGNTTACVLRAIIPDWDNKDNVTQRALVEDLITIKKKSALKTRLLGHWKFDLETSIQLCLLELEPGHSNHSLKAVNKLFPYLQSGLIYSDARQNAGYGYDQKEREPSSVLPPPPEIPNPIVQKALHELRRLTNAIIAEYGKPDFIRLEMARDLEMNTKRYKAYVQRQKENEKANDEAADKYVEMTKSNPHLRLSEKPSRDDKLKYRLWKDQDYRCAYSNEQISLTTLFSPEIDIDHILPYSLTLDNSYMNKVVCYAGENRYKGKRTPYDVFGGSDRWEQIVQSISRWPKTLISKRNRFFMSEKDLEERDFISNQLNDTRYICREAQSYLGVLGSDITVSKGMTTALLRRMWNLNTLLGTQSIKQRDDHRHHAVDATVIACVDRSLYQALVGMVKQAERERPELNLSHIHLDEPWSTLRSDLKSQLDRMVVSHTPQRKLSGALHEDTGAGFIDGVGTVYRKTLNGDFKPINIESIIDPEVRKLIKQHLQNYNNKPKDAFAEGVTVYHKDGETPIRRVRLTQSKTSRTKLNTTKYGVKDRSGNVFKWMSYGNFHHLEILKDVEEDDYYGLSVTTMEAHKRVKGIGCKKQSIIKTSHGDTHKFIMSLHINDTVSLEVDGKRSFFVIQKLGNLSQGKQPRPLLKPHTLSSGEEGKVTDSIRNLMVRYHLQFHKVNAIGKVLE